MPSTSRSNRSKRAYTWNELAQWDGINNNRILFDSILKELDPDGTPT